jgi:hypothetical protein
VTLEVVNGVLQLKPAGDPSQVGASADGLTLESVSGALRVKAADSLEPAILGTVTAPQPLLTAQQLSDELQLTKDNAAMVVSLLNELIALMQQGKPG